MDSDTTTLLSSRLVIITECIVKYPEIFNHREFTNDLDTFKEKVLAADGCFDVQILIERTTPCTKFFFISTWTSYEAWVPHMESSYTKRMTKFSKKYLSEYNAYVTEEYF